MNRAACVPGFGRRWHVHVGVLEGVHRQDCGAQQHEEHAPGPQGRGSSRRFNVAVHREVIQQQVKFTHDRGIGRGCAFGLSAPPVLA